MMKSNQFKQLRIIGVLVLTMGLALTSCKNSPVSSVDEEEAVLAMQAMDGVSAANSETTSNVYISDSNVDTYDPIFPATADPNWESVVCKQSNNFGINASWSNPHKAFQVGTHPWETNTFDAYWINASNTMSSTGTIDSDNNSGPGGVAGQDELKGHNWTRYEKQVAGNGDFQIQLLADNCSWVYLADENGSNPELIGFQAVTSTPGNYGVLLDGNHTLIFIIYDGGNLAGGKFRLETTETPLPPIEPEEPETNVYTSQAGLQTYEPILVTRNADHATSQCTDDGSIGQYVVGINDPRWEQVDHGSYSVRDQLPANYNNEFTFERAWGGIYGLDEFNAEWINAKDTWRSDATVPSDYSGSLPYSGANWTRHELEVEGNGNFELKLLADDCSWIYLSDEDGNNPRVIGYQDNPGLNGPEKVNYGVTLDGKHLLTFIVFDQGGEAGGKFILETTTDVVDPYVPPTPVNNAPTADAGADQTVTATGQTTSVALDGSGSSDPDGDGLSYSWTLNGNEVATTASANVDLAEGSYTLILTVSDGELSDSDEVTITVANSAPVADAGEDQSMPATGQTTSVTLDGSGSADPNGDILTYSWTLNGDEVSTDVSPTVNLAKGIYIYKLTVSDGDESDSDEVSVSVVNTAPVANAGEDQTMPATGQTTSITLDGSGSADPNGDTLTYSWKLNGDEVSTDVSPTLNLADGTYTYTLTVSDGELDDSDEVIVKVENTVPVANAGSDITKDATGQTTPVTLDGSGSSDADNDALSYSWTLNGDEVADTETATIELADGDYVITLVVSDGQGASTSDEVNVSVNNTTPLANAGDDVTTEATGATTSVTLIGSGRDADGDALTYAWSNGDAGTSTTVDLAVGQHTFTLTVSDGQGASHTDEVVITIIDETAPVITFNQESNILWPPNHKMVLVATGISASDKVDGATDVTVTVTSSEASNGKGDGNTDSDWEVVTNADGSKDVYVRSERSGKGNGRTYTVSMTTEDTVGNSSSESFDVQVAKSQGGGKAKGKK